VEKLKIMYRIFRASTLYYENYMKDAGYRYRIIKPLMLLTSTMEFSKAKENNTPEYISLKLLINEIQRLSQLNEDRYHHFEYFLNELYTLGFRLDEMPNSIKTSDSRKEIIKDQIDLILQFFAGRYPYDEFDNKSGSHDIKNNKFIFIQP
jgi:hypothetical protein